MLTIRGVNLGTRLSDMQVHVASADLLTRECNLLQDGFLPSRQVRCQLDPLTFINNSPRTPYHVPIELSLLSGRNEVSENAAFVSFFISKNGYRQWRSFARMTHFGCAFMPLSTLLKWMVKLYYQSNSVRKIASPKMQLILTCGSPAIGQISKFRRDKIVHRDLFSRAKCDQHLFHRLAGGID